VFSLTIPTNVSKKIHSATLGVPAHYAPEEKVAILRLLPLFLHAFSPLPYSENAFSISN
jgi:hypothetical protein